MTIPSALIGAAFFVAVTAGPASTVAADETVEVWKSPSCGCCNGWVDHLRENGFEVVTHDVGDLSLLKQMAGVPEHLQSCHTAKVGDYVIEGHVPETAIGRLLEQRSDIAGLAVPGMPAGSPGMPSPTPERFQVLTFGDGEPDAFATFVGPDED